METIVDPLQIRELVRMPALIEALAAEFRSECTVPPRTVATVPGGADSAIEDLAAARLTLDAVRAS